MRTVRHAVYSHRSRDLAAGCQFPLDFDGKPSSVASSLLDVAMDAQPDGYCRLGSDIFILDIDYEIDDLLPHSKTWLPAAASALILL